MTTVHQPPARHLPQLRIERPLPGVAMLVLDNPSQRNAMSLEMTESWVAAVAELRADDSVRAVVVTGAGEGFCSGADTSWLASASETSVDVLRTRMLAFYRAWLSIRSLEVPTIAAINGAAIGAGLCLPLACDLRYAATGAAMAVPFTRLGLHAGMAGTYFLPEVVGVSAARDLLLTGRAVRDEEAVRMGLVSAVVPADELRGRALEAAEQIAATAPVATRLTTLALRNGHRDLESALQWEGLAQPVTMATEDLVEGIRAVRERRAPRFTGR